MSDASHSFWKSLAIFLLFILFGVYALYEWYDDQLYAQLDEKDEQIKQIEQQMRNADSQRVRSEEVQEAIRSEIANLKAHSQEEKQRLEAQVAANDTARADLERAMTGLKAAHAAEIAAAQEETAGVATQKELLAARLSTLETDYEAAQSQAAALQADLGKVQTAIADSAAEHQARIDALERHLNERVELARITPMDENLLRTAQAVGVLPMAEALQQESQSMDSALAASKSELEAMQADHAAVQQQLAETREQLERVQEELAESKSAATAAVETSDTPPEGDQEATAALNARLAAEAEVRDALQQQHTTALAALNEQLEDTQRQLASAKQELAQSQTREQERQTQPDTAEPRIQTLEARLADERTQAAEAQAALQEQIGALEERLADAQSQLEQFQAQAGATDQTTDARLEEATTRIQAMERELAQARSEAETGKRSAAELVRLRERQEGFAQLRGAYTDYGFLLRLAESELRFPLGEATLPKGKLESLDRIAALLGKQPEVSVRVEGHTDSVGSDAINLELSKARAQAVLEALIERGIAPDRLQADGIGAARPIADNATPKGRSMNRRVEIYLVD